MARLLSFGSRLQKQPDAGAGASLRFHKELPYAVPVFGGGGISSVALAVTLTFQFDRPAFWVWSGMETVLLGLRLWRARTGAEEPGWAARSAMMCELAGAVSIGFGSALAISTGTWLGTLLGWIAATAFAGETCVRNLGNRRLIAAMLAIGAAPAIIACFASGLPALQLAAALTGLFVVRMALAANDINVLLVDTMRAERESDHRARHDRLTGLLNLAGFEREIELMRNEDPRATLTLFFIDLDHFKQVNDTLGHSAGDRMLRTVAERLLELVGPRDIVARIGGDEFIVVTALDIIEPTEFAAALLAAIEREHGDVGGKSLPVTASIGIAQSTSTGDLAGIMTVADNRLYAAKRAGGAQANADD